MLTDADPILNERVDITDKGRATLHAEHVIAPRLVALPGSAPTQAQLDEIIDRAYAVLDEARALLGGDNTTISLSIHDVPGSVFNAFPQEARVLSSGTPYKDVGSHGRLGIFLSFDERPQP